VDMTRHRARETGGLEGRKRAKRDIGRMKVGVFYSDDAGDGKKMCQHAVNTTTP